MGATYSLKRGPELIVSIEACILLLAQLNADLFTFVEGCCCTGKPLGQRLVVTFHLGLSVSRLVGLIKNHRACFIFSRSFSPLPLPCHLQPRSIWLTNIAINVKNN